MKKKKIIAGVDEAGRGCLAGPVVAAAVILPNKYPKALLKDSKILSAKKRQLAFDWITKHCCYGIGTASHTEIDALGIKKATELAMQHAVASLTKVPELLHIDGCDGFCFTIPAEQFVSGDSLFAEISAASIVAKVTRDNLMQALALEFPEFCFDKHKGYGVKMHYELITAGKYCAIHRKCFAPLRTLLATAAIDNL